ncbi:hypothetical protein BGZ63DRAFT_353234 [Mariannaea sp. PMI_226]|nr:hypothetical protein BGZ63DRAFT_353234 [Mariannaea sp. PMI_226]
MTFNSPASPIIVSSLASKPFVFVVGEELKTFHIHKDLIGQLSPALSALVNGRMKEAREGRVEWPDLDVDTFVRFAKYAYSRDYVEADPEMLPHPPPPAPEIAQPQDSQSSQNQMIDLTNQADGGSVGEDTPANDDEQSCANLKYSAMRRFVKLEMEHPDDLWEPRPNVDPYEKYEPVFMSHVRLYALAEKYGIEKLKTLTLHRMHLALQRFTIFPERVGDVVCIVPIIYDYTVAGDMAREMIVQFFCCVAEHVKVNRDFRFALRSVGEFADDLFQEMTSRLL